MWRSMNDAVHFEGQIIYWLSFQVQLTFPTFITKLSTQLEPMITLKMASITAQKSTSSIYKVKIFPKYL